MILVVSNMYPSAEYPNYGVFVRNFVEELSKTNEVKVVTLRKKNSKIAKILGYILFYFKVFFEYISGKYDLTYVHYAGYNSPPILFGKRFNKKTKLIVNVHGSDVTPEKKLEEKTNFLTGKLIHTADLTIVPSPYFQQVVEEKYGKVNIYVSPSAGVNLDLFHKDSSIEPLEEAFTIGYVSRIDEEKGWDILIKAFKNLSNEIPNLRLIMVGGGAQEADAVKMIHDYNLEDKIKKIGMLSQEELVEVYSILDTFIFPSTRAAESLGLVGLEAMACEIPIIGSDFGGIKTYVKNESNGLLFSPGSFSALEDSIRKYYYLPNEIKLRMKKEALETAKRYDSKLVNKQVIDKIYEVLER